MSLKKKVFVRPPMVLPYVSSESRYDVRLARSSREVESALRLRHDVFNVELAASPAVQPSGGLEFDEYDFQCRHLIVVERATDRTVGTYRLNSIETAGAACGFYSFNEFTLEDLPPEVLEQGVEIGRACIAPEHRNTKVLFLLWKGLANYLTAMSKRFFFGCCSVFTRDRLVGARVYRQLAEGGFSHPTFGVEPRKNGLGFRPEANESVPLPSLFEMYLRIGARVCGPPMVDEHFGTIDFFVVFDLETMNEKYRRMFFG